MEGKVKFFNRTKGYGFIVGDDGQDYFVHQTQVTQGVILNENDVVSFESQDGERGKQAHNVKLAEGSSAPAEESEDSGEADDSMEADEDSGDSEEADDSMEADEDSGDSEEADDSMEADEDSEEEKPQE